MLMLGILERSSTWFSFRCFFQELKKKLKCDLVHKLSIKYSGQILFLGVVLSSNGLLIRYFLVK